MNVRLAAPLAMVLAIVPLVARSPVSAQERVERIVVVAPSGPRLDALRPGALAGDRGQEPATPDSSAFGDLLVRGALGSGAGLIVGGLTAASILNRTESTDLGHGELFILVACVGVASVAGTTIAARTVPAPPDANRTGALVGGAMLGFLPASLVGWSATAIGEAGAVVGVASFAVVQGAVTAYTATR